MGGFVLMEIRDYKSGDEKKILELFNLTFGKPLSEFYWKWRFIDNPEKKVMIKLMWEKETLAGHYAVSPLKLKVGGESILSALSMTTMTHPDYAGRGIFTELAEKLYQDEAVKNQLKAVWGFPNANSHYGFIKNLKWENLEQIPTFSIHVNKLKTTNSSEINIVQEFNLSHMRALELTNQGYGVKVEKSIDFLTWRYIQNPSNKYQIFEMKNNDSCFFAVTKVFPSFSEKNKFEVDIVELNFPNDLDALIQLMNSIRDYYKNCDFSKINTWMPLNSGNHLLLEKIGFLNTVPITYSGIRILDSNFNSLCPSKDWHYSMGDSDVY